MGSGPTIVLVIAPIPAPGFVATVFVILDSKLAEGIRLILDDTLAHRLLGVFERIAEFFVVTGQSELLDGLRKWSLVIGRGRWRCGSRCWRNKLVFFRTCNDEY
jgi:hypothetical protein